MRPPRPRRCPCPRLPVPGHGRRDTGSLCRRRAGPGPGRRRQRLQLDLQRAPATLLHSGDLLIARYAEGHYLAHRLLEGNEMGADEGERLDLPRQVRLLFGALPLDGLPDAERERLQAQRQALGLCDRRASVSRYRVAGTEVYRLRGSQAGKPYHALYLLDGPQVHYLDSSGSDAFVEQLLASLRRR
ncbi:hypothetical protein ISE67_21780 [Pseudomonas aeruginosa]|nr:hypothetical protein [Pseudomonas aeruginosa]KAB0774722.1 hypothetical protein F7P00_17590 [Pseudomonas aeruginosa]MBX6033340.1 hypothetical protein [Pseudomonas aeruginosa]HCF1067970.1 hypothetical protein [Pseudomonas aeruginosa]HCF7356432.1 hypothetical protein [Pseudomonas aeruginosa]